VMRVLVTGANGFLGKNLLQHLAERADIEVVAFTRDDNPSSLKSLLDGVDFVFHLAGVNRSQDESDFTKSNIALTQCLCDAIIDTGRYIPIVFSSSIQSSQNNLYGLSKRAAENILFSAGRASGLSVHIFRLPNVFGKWCMPNYNSVVATFCYNIARGLPIQINNPSAVLELVYIDDLIHRFIELMDGADAKTDLDGFEIILPQYTITVGDLSRQIQIFKQSRSTLMMERVGTGLMRALYSTYVSYLPASACSYPLPIRGDQRGVFVEILKTPDCGQFSYFTAHPGITRGGHYHHSKTEKFLIVKGRARFNFRHLITNETFELITSAEKSEIVETIPGWAHDITNIGDDEMIVMLWANEVFDNLKSDTYAHELRVNL
jgi:UDP-2-acetamido-2,6-beta-L-arabino-hexul-4-ose reductase